MTEQSEFKYIPSLGKGLNKHNRSDLISEQEVSEILNFRIYEDSLILCKGYEKLTTGFSDGTVSDVEELGKRIKEYELTSGISVLVAFTNYCMYHYDGAVWDLVPRDTSVIVSSVTVGTETLTITAHGQSDNDLVKFSTTDTLPAGMSPDVIYYVIVVDANNIQLALTSSGSAIDLTDVGIGTHTMTPCFSGEIAEPLCMAVYTPLDALIWCNSVDPIQKYVYSGGAYTLEPLGGLTGGAMAGTATVVNACKAMLVWNERLYIFNTIEDTENLPQMIRWSDVANIEEWDDTAPKDGGYLRLSDREDKIQNAVRLGDDVIVYRNHSIVKGVWVGSASRTAKWIEMISEEGSLGPNCIADVGDSHIFFGFNDIYRYKGGSTLDPVGTRVRRMIFGEDGLLDIERDVDITAVHIRSLKEVWFSMLYGTSTDVLGNYNSYKSIVFIYSVANDSWTIREFGSNSLDIRISDIIEARLEAGVTWADMDQFWTGVGELAWNTQIFATDFPNLLMCSKSDIFNYDHVIDTDDAVEIPFYVDTKDFESGNQYSRFTYLDLKTSGGGCNVYYSIDRGNTYTQLASVEASISFINTKIFLNISAQSIRFRVAGSGGGFKLASLGFKYAIDSEF